MDAISFVLGLDAKKLRAGTLTDLVNEEAQKHNKKVTNMKDARDCYVKLVFIDNAGEERIFTRSLRLKVDVAGNRSYTDIYAHGDSRDRQGYINGLSSIGVLVEVPNCLVFQVRSFRHSILCGPIHELNSCSFCTTPQISRILSPLPKMSLSSPHMPLTALFPAKG